MNRQRPSLKALRTLEAVCRHQSLTRAAQELHITPPAVSQQLNSIAERFGERPVVNRNGRIQAAPIVESGLADLRDGFDRIDAAVTRMLEYRTSRRLTVTVEPSFAAAWLLRRLFRFTDLHPDISVRLDASAIVVDLMTEDVSIAIRYGPGSYPGLRADKLMSEEVIPVCAPSLLEGLHPLRTPEDLRWHTLLHDDTATADKSWLTWHKWIRETDFDVDPDSGVHFAQSNLVIEAAVEGHGVALVGKVMIGDHLESGKLLRPFGAEVSGPAAYGYYVVSREDKANNPDVAAFREWVVGQVSCTDKRPTR